MSWTEKLADARRRFAREIAQLHANAVGLCELEKQRLRQLCLQLESWQDEQVEKAFELSHLGLTQNGLPIFLRAAASWEKMDFETGEFPWDDVSCSASGFGVGGLPRIGLLESHRLPPELRSSLGVPALIPLICARNLIIEATGEVLEQGNAAMQSLAFRLLTTIPAGKIRITGIDPTGQGANFKACLNLSDHIIGPKVLHDEAEIEQALRDMIAHMSMVTQKYLKDRYHTIDEFNASANEIAEPYRLLLIANFPAGFKPHTAERLSAIAETGPHRGVHVLMTLDTARPLPHGFNVKELERHATVMRERSGALLWVDGPVPEAMVRLDPRPPANIANALSEALNPLAKAASVVRVPFESLLAHSPWSATSEAGITVQLGTKGADDPLELSFGYSDDRSTHHALIGGRTGMGKTMLLHVLISNLAHRYPPDELELFLIDFKGGVEFQVYRCLPHARVLAIKSEREFGVSVLDGLRDELARREELFRESGFNDLSTWRENTGESLARIILIVDEFQVFFEVNDGIAGTARGLLS